MNELLSVEEANVLIDRGCVLHIAGVEEALSQLHPGCWIGGTTPYILTTAGGVVEREKVFVTELPVPAARTAIRFVDIGHIPAISTEAPRNGFSIVIAPAMSEIHTIYSLAAANVPGIREIALIGWISGVEIDERAHKSAKVFNGLTGESASDRIVVMHCTLPPEKIAHVDIVNLVKPGQGDEFVFDATSFDIRECAINGERADFYDYVTTRDLPIHCPLVTEFNGENISASLKTVDHEGRVVHLYAPVMRGRVYRLAESVPDYRGALVRFAEEQKLKPVLSVNCVHNFHFGGLKGDHFIPLPGPAVFGELAHVLMNQTLVCLTVRDK